MNLPFIVFSVGLSVCWALPTSDEPKALTDEMVNYVNSLPHNTWKAGSVERFNSIADVRLHLGVLPRKTKRLPTLRHSLRSVTLPTSFDSRKAWPECPSIGQIRDQSKCGSCWAFGAVEAMSDRTCIHSNFTKNVEISARDLLSCCLECGHGCDGGYPDKAWDYWLNIGLVSGGSKEENSGCEPYPFPACKHYELEGYASCTKTPYKTPSCKHQCRKGYDKDYDEDKIYGRSAYQIEMNEDQIKQEIMTNGPVEADFTVFADFPHYKSGVYKRTVSTVLGGHAVKILGWGVEDDVPYWLVANSWNEEWGEHGYFKILRGADECGIEADIVAGLPAV